MLKVPSFHILSPLRGEREGKKNPSAQMQFGKGNGFLVEAFLYVLELLRLSAVPWLVFRIDWGTATKCCKCILPQGSGCWAEVLGTFPFPAEHTWHTSFCKCTFVRFPLGLVIFLFLKWLGSNKLEGQGVFGIYCSFCIFFPFLNQSLI